MNEAQATKLLADGVALVAALSALIPTLADNVARIKAGLASDDADDLNAKIVEAHGQIQALDAQLAALKSA